MDLRNWRAPIAQPALLTVCRRLPRLNGSQSSASIATSSNIQVQASVHMTSERCPLPSTQLGVRPPRVGAGERPPRTNASRPKVSASGSQRSRRAAWRRFCRRGSKVRSSASWSACAILAITRPFQRRIAAGCRYPNAASVRPARRNRRCSSAPGKDRRSAGSRAREHQRPSSAWRRAEVVEMAPRFQPSQRPRRSGCSVLSVRRRRPGAFVHTSRILAPTPDPAPIHLPVTWRLTVQFACGIRMAEPRCLTIVRRRRSFSMTASARRSPIDQRPCSEPGTAITLVLPFTVSPLAGSPRRPGV